MTEMIIPSERVQELTTAPRRLPIEVEGSVTYEVAVNIWASINPKNTHSANDLGKGWHENIRRQTGDELTEELTTLGGPYCSSWLAVSALMLGAPHPHDPDHVFEWLKTVTDQRLRRWIIGYYSQNDDQALIEQAATGDVEAAVELVGDRADKKPGLVDHVQWVLTTENLPARFAGALRQFRQDVFSEFEEDFAGAINRAAAARRAAPTRGSAKEIVEEVTSGIDFEIPAGISRVVLIPSMIIRPLSLIDALRGTLIVYYGIADEFIDDDPEAPPSWLVRTYKALSDDRRLRILRRVGEGPASLDDLSDLLGLSKSTIHHHVGILRGAGLIRVHVKPGTGKKKSYTVRGQGLVDANAFLDDYLAYGEEQQGA